MPSLPTVALPDGRRVPALGQGTWNIGDRAERLPQEAAALTAGLDLGMTLIDTAEMYGEGGAEKVVAQAIRGRRAEVFVVSKVYPHNAGRKSAIAACERSLARLGIEQLDLYLLHWRGRIPLAETIDAFERLRGDGKIARWGVSNFDTDDMEELAALPEGSHCAANQVLYHLGERGVEWSLLPWMRQRRMPLMAYSPLGQGALLKDRRLAAIAAEADLPPVQVALAWLLRTPDVMVIPQSATIDHIRMNHSSTGVALPPATLAALDAAFPPPSRATSLRML